MKTARSFVGHWTPGRRQWARTRCQGSDPLMRTGSHRRPVTGGPVPVIDPALADRIRPFDQIVARSMPVFDHEHDAGIEIPLRVIDIGNARSLRRDHVLNRDLDSFRLEDRTPVSVFACRYEI